MKTRLRIYGSISGLLGLLFLFFALIDLGGGIGSSEKEGVGKEELSCRFQVREKLLSGAYKVYGLKDQAVSMWLAKTVFRNNTAALIRDLKVRYKLGDYSDWCTWQVYPELVPTQTVVDLYNPILPSRIAKLMSRTPAELQMQCEYVDADGIKQTLETNQRLTLLSCQDFFFTDLKSEEWTGSFQDISTYSPLLAAWVTYQDPAVTGLAAIANERAKGVGAGSSDQACFAVMQELYEVLRAIRITYQHPAHRIEKDKTFDIMLIQTLQYPRDTIRKRSGTCIDLAILYAAMMQSVGIKPFLVTLDGHCFPIGVTPSGMFVPVEATCVGGGGKDSGDFETAVKIAQKEWEQLQQTGRYVLVDLQQCWGEGIAPPELDPLAADILERWNITEMARSGTQSFYEGRTKTTHPPLAQLVSGNWSFKLTQPDGRQLPGTAQVVGQGSKVQIIFVLSYQVYGPYGYEQNALEKNLFEGTLQGQQLVAQCNQAEWTLDGQYVQPQGLPYTLRVNVAANGRAAQGSVANSAGMTSQIFMQTN